MFRVIPCLFAVLLSAAPASADLLPEVGQVVSHNGSLTSDPPGTGDVDVLFDHGNVLFGPYRGDFFEIDSHVVEYLYSPELEENFIFAGGFITNQTAVPWTGFRIELSRADFTGWSLSRLALAPENNPVVDYGFISSDISLIDFDEIGIRHHPSGADQFTLLGSSITRSNDSGTGFLDAELVINFGDPVPPGQSFWLDYHIVPPAGNPMATGFTARFTPVPEPSTIVVIALGAFAALRRRRFTDLV